MKPVAALCVECGEPVPLRVAETPAPCPHCHAEAPLTADLRRSLAALAARLGPRAPAGQRLLQRPTPLRRGRTLRLAALPVGLLTALALLLVITASAGPVDFLFGVHGRRAGWFDFGAHSRWWATLLWLLGAGVSTVWTASIALRMRRVARHIWPRAPFGQAPRCRLCGDDLPGIVTEGAALVRCDRCRADHVVVPGRYRRSPRNADRAVEDFARAIDRPLTVLEAEAEGSLGAALVLTLGPLVFGGLGALLLRETAPRLLLLPLGAVALAGAMLAFGRWRWPLPSIPYLGTLPVGTEVELPRGRLTVLTHLVPPWWRRRDRRPWVILGEPRVAQGQVALRIDERQGSVSFDAFELDAGGDGLAEGETVTRLRPTRESRILAEGRSPVYVTDRAPIRIYKGKPVGSSVPRFTLEPIDLDESDLTIAR